MSRIKKNLESVVNKDLREHQRANIFVKTLLFHQFFDREIKLLQI